MDRLGGQCLAKISLQLRAGCRCIIKSFLLSWASVIGLHDLVCLCSVDRVMLCQRGSRVVVAGKASALMSFALLQSVLRMGASR